MRNLLLAVLSSCSICAIAQNVGIGTASPTASLHIVGNNGVLATGTLGSGTIPTTGAGIRMMWYPTKAAFRAGYASGTQWDTVNSGLYSVAMGNSTTAGGNSSTAFGYKSIASGDYSFVAGYQSTASDTQSIALGSSCVAQGRNSIAVGFDCSALGNYSIAIGTDNNTSNNNSVAIGNGCNGYNGGTAIGYNCSTFGANSTALGYQTIGNATESFAAGVGTNATSFMETELGAFNVSPIPNSATSWNASDRLFGVGKGQSIATRQDALVILKNGNTGIGISVPTQLLDIEGAGGNPVNSATTASTAMFRLENYASTYDNTLDIGNIATISGGSWIQATNRTNLSQSYSLALNPNGGYVGISTSTPASLLYVGSGTTAAGAQAGLNVAVGGNSYITVSDGTRTTFMGADNNGYGMIGTITNSDFVIRSDNADRIRIAAGGFVGIGTSSPNAPLHISTATSNGITTASLARTYFLEGPLATNLTSNTNASGNIMVQADGWYWANGGGYVATSDARIKNIKGKTDNASDLGTLSQIEVTDYKYIDRLANGDKQQKKVIAQQINEVYPQAISCMEGIIPSVYDTACSVKIHDGVTVIETVKPHGFKTGDEVKLITENTGEKILPVTVIDENAFSVAEPLNDRIFVYGKKVKDLLTVDYDAISMLNVSATQELYKLLIAEKARNQVLEQEISKLQDQNKAIQYDVDKLKASVETMLEILGSKAQCAIR